MATTSTRKRKAPAKAALTPFQQQLNDIVERVGNGTLIALRAVMYKEFNEKSGFFVIVDDEQDVSGTLWVNNTSIPDRFRTSAGKELQLLSPDGADETIEIQSRGMKHGLYFFAAEVGTVEVSQPDGEKKLYLDIENDDIEPTYVPKEVFEEALNAPVAG